MIHTPLGTLNIEIDGRTVAYAEVPRPICAAFPDLSGRFLIPVWLPPDGCAHTVACRIVGYEPSARDREEGGERLECRSFFRGAVKLSLGMEGDMCFLDGKRMTDYDYDNEQLPDGVQYRTFPETKTTQFFFGVAWMRDCTEYTELQTWLAADPVS